MAANDERETTMGGHGRRIHADERGEGVISAAIAVLIMAFLGAAMWVGFNTIWDDAEQDVQQQVDRIGDDVDE